MINTHETVSALLAKARVLRVSCGNHGMHCVGCAIAPFETLAEGRTSRRTVRRIDVERDRTHASRVRRDALMRLQDKIRKEGTVLRKERVIMSGDAEPTLIGERA